MLLANPQAFSSRLGPVCLSRCAVSRSAQKASPPAAAKTRRFLVFTQTSQPPSHGVREQLQHKHDLDELISRFQQSDSCERSPRLGDNQSWYGSGRSSRFKGHSVGGKHRGVDDERDGSSKRSTQEADKRSPQTYEQYGSSGWSSLVKGNVADRDAPTVVSYKSFFEHSDSPYTLTVMEGTAESVKTAAGPNAQIAGDFETCLIEPVTEMAADLQITAEEQQANMTWGVDAVSTLQTHLTGAGVKVAVLDTGLDKAYREHPAFEGINVMAKNFTTEDVEDWDDRRGHGTHCLGTILGRPVDGMRIGVAPGVTDVLVAKVIPDCGRGSSDMLADGIMWAWQNGANVINISLAYDLPAQVAKLKRSGSSLEEAAAEVLQMQADHTGLLQTIMQEMQYGHLRNPPRPPPIVIAAAGNGSTTFRKVQVQLPAALKGVVSVAAIKKSSQGFEPAEFSNIGASVCAPGVLVWSAASSSTATNQPLLRVESGTSMAAPHAAGVAALWWQYARNIEQRQVRIADAVAARLCGLATCAGFAPGTDKKFTGMGLVQAPNTQPP